MLLRVHLLLLPLFVSCGFPLCLGFSVKHGGHDKVAQRLLPGIWKLWLDTDILPFLPNQKQQKQEPLPIIQQERIQQQQPPRDEKEESKDTPRDSSDNLQKEAESTRKDEILVKLNPDGSFRQCTENYQEGRWLSGRWKFLRKEIAPSSSSSTNSLLLALDRQYYGPPMDILLQGNLQPLQHSQDLREQKGDNEDTNEKNCTSLSEKPLNETTSDNITAAAASSASSAPSLSPTTVGLVQGNVWTGKFMYPKRHSQFFEQQQPPPLPPALISSSPVPKCVGTFSMQQAVATFSILSESSSSSFSSLPKATPKFKASDFYGRCFILTVEPIAAAPTRQQPQQQQQQQPMTNDDDNLRAMPIQFFPNNTFQAVHTNKILRGRFGVTTTTVQTTKKDDDRDDNDSVIVTGRDELWFQVSLFGSGRSVPGSVYSEGIGLSHQDQRSYVGEILQHKETSEKSRAKTEGASLFSSSLDQQKQKQQQQQRLFVAGSVTYGSDLGSDARPEPVGQFLLTEISDAQDGVFGLLRVEDDDEDDDDEEEEQENKSEIAIDAGDGETMDGTEDDETLDSVFQ